MIFTLIPLIAAQLPELPDGVKAPNRRNKALPKTIELPDPPAWQNTPQVASEGVSCAGLSGPDPSLCNDINFPICSTSVGAQGVCSKCQSDKECRDPKLTKGGHRRPLGLFKCTTGGRCEGIHGDDDITQYGNNQQHTKVGTVNDVAIRNCHSDTPLKPRDSPSPRKVSNEAHNRVAGSEGMKYQKTRNGTKKNKRVANVLAVFFGQFIDHDVTLFGEQHSNNDQFDVQASQRDLEEDDDLQNLFLPKNTFAHGRDPFSGEELEPNRAAENEITSFLDASTTYGSDPTKLDTLRLKAVHGCKDLDISVCEPDCYINRPTNGKPTCQPKLGCHQAYMATMDPKDCDPEKCIWTDKAGNAGASCSAIPGRGINGLLKANRDNDENGFENLPPKVHGKGCQGNALEGGDDRAAENSILTQVHTIFFREHNRIARQYKKNNVKAGDNEVFRFARKLVKATFQRIVMEEWLPLFVDEDKLQYKGYDPTQTPQIANEFAGAAFRWGHSALPDQITIKDGKSLRLHQLFSNARPLFNTFDGLFYGTLAQPMEKADGDCIEEIRNMLFRTLDPAEGNINPKGTEDLVTRNLHRGRLLELPSFLEIAQCAKYNPLLDENTKAQTTANGIRTSAENMAKLVKAYGDVKTQKVDLFTGLLSEEAFDDTNPDKLGFSKLLSVILEEQFNRIMHADRFWYKNVVFTNAELSYMSGSMAQVIRRNTGIYIRGDVFTIPEPEESKTCTTDDDCAAGMCIASECQMPGPYEKCDPKCGGKSECDNFCTQWGKCCQKGVDRPGCNKVNDGIPIMVQDPRTNKKEPKFPNYAQCVPNGKMPVVEGGPQMNSERVQGTPILQQAVCGTRKDFEKCRRGATCFWNQSGSTGECISVCPVTAGQSNHSMRTCRNGDIVQDSAATGGAITTSKCDTVIRGGVSECSRKYPVMCNKRGKYDYVCAKSKQICDESYKGVRKHLKDGCDAEYQICGSYTCSDGTSPKLDNPNQKCSAQGCDNAQCCVGQENAPLKCSARVCSAHKAGAKVPKGKCVVYEGIYWRSEQPDATRSKTPSETETAWTKCGEVPKCLFSHALPTNAEAGKCFDTRDNGSGDEAINLYSKTTEHNAGTVCYHKCKSTAGEKYEAKGYFSCDADGKVKDQNAKCEIADADDCNERTGFCVEASTDADTAVVKQHKDAQEQCPKTCAAVNKEAKRRKGDSTWSAANARLDSGEDSQNGLLVWAIISGILLALSFAIIGFLTYLLMRGRRKTNAGANGNSE